MPVPMCLCAVCKNMVTKRSTIHVEKLGGRACREHPEVQKIVQEAADKARVDAEWKKAAETLQVISLAATMRGMHTMRGMPISLMKANLRLSGVSQEIIDKAEAEVQARGGYQMTDEEVTTAMIGAMELAKKQMLFDNLPKEIGVRDPAWKDGISQMAEAESKVDDLGNPR